jgi:hypothetical protein
MPRADAFPLHGLVVLERVGVREYVERWRAGGTDV